MTKMQDIMNPSIIDEKFFEEGFKLTAGANETIVHRKDDTSRPFISTRDAWKNYSDDELYEIERALRDWMETMSKCHDWVSTYKNRRYDFAALWWCIFGTESRYDALAKSNTAKISHLFAYYSSSVRSGYRGAKWAMAKQPKKMYCISPKRLKEPPYSLRLRIEWFAERGIEPTFKNMKLPKDDLDIYQSRYKKTQKQIDKRRKLAYEGWQKKYGDKYDNAYHRQKYKEEKEREAASRQCGSGEDGENVSCRNAGSIADQDLS